MAGEAKLDPRRKLTPVASVLGGTVDRWVLPKATDADCELDDDQMVDSPGPSARAALELGAADSGVNVVELDAFLASNAAHRDGLYRAVDSALHPEDRRSAARELAENPVEWMGYALMPADELEVFDAAMADDDALDAAMSKMPLISLTKMHLYGPALAERVWRNAVPDADMKYADRLMAVEDAAVETQAVDARVYERQMHAVIADSSAAPADRAAAGQDLLGTSHTWPGLAKLPKDDLVALWAASKDEVKMLAAINKLPSLPENQQHLTGGALAEQLHKDNVAPPAAPAPKPKNGYITMYKGRKYEVYADTSYEAQQIAVAQIQDAHRGRKTRVNSYDVDVYLAELAGEQVTSVITN